MRAKELAQSQAHRRSAIPGDIKGGVVKDHHFAFQKQPDTVDSLLLPL